MALTSERDAVREVRTGRAYHWKVTLSGLAGNTLELYDFLLYGTAASLFFPSRVFPQPPSTSTPSCSADGRLRCFVGAFSPRTRTRSSPPWRAWRRSPSDSPSGP